jgi:4-hydroxybenzoate polyprenyltransferase
MQSYFSLVKFSHTIFALPFALIGYFLAVQLPEFGFQWSTFGLIIICMITGRNAAMAFNRYIDRDIDADNPRTQTREIPKGIINANRVLAFVFINVILFIITTYFINRLCFFLSPVAIAIILGYSYTKRFTALCHFILGLGLSLAPVGAYLAVTASFDWIPVLYGSVVLFWVSGFDIIYALQDEDYDKESNLYSVPQLLGARNALILSNVSHILCALLLGITSYLVFQQYDNIGWIHIGGILVFIGLLYYQHTLVTYKDISKVNLAFFTTNGIASLILGLAVIIDFLY